MPKNNKKKHIFQTIAKEYKAITKIPLEKEKNHSLNEITWRIFRIMAEFVEGFELLSETHKEVTIYGSTRLKTGTKWHTEAEKLGKILAKHGFTVITGGGPGIMEAANKGAYENGGESIGLNIQLPFEQRLNPYLTKSKGFYYFFTRRVMLAASAQAYIFFPGGFGTLDEFFEIVTLIQTNKMMPTPIVCVGKQYWSKLDSFIKSTCLEQFKTISPKDYKLYQIVDSAEEAYNKIKQSKERTIF